MIRGEIFILRRLTLSRGWPREHWVQINNTCTILCPEGRKMTDDFLRDFRPLFQHFQNLNGIRRL